MNAISTKQNEIIAEFQAIPDWQERYRRIIDAGKQLDRLPEDLRVDRYLVRGCQSQVWLHAALVDGCVRLRGDSDASIVRGLVALLLRVFDGATPAELATVNGDFLDQLGFDQNLSQTRANGLASMIKQIRLYGVAFAALAAQAPRS